MRKLASIQQITDIQPIEGRDRIVLAQVLGWHVIVTTDFKIGDLCCYIEIDSVLPEKPEFEFLRPKKFKIKTMKMAGVISQGICFPLSILPERSKPYEIGEDVTEVIGVTHIEETVDDPAPADQQIKRKGLSKWLMRFAWYRKMVLPKPKSDFPSAYVRKTDEDRIQAVPWMLSEKNREQEWIATEKVDGTSGTFLLVQHKGLFGRKKLEYFVCSRNRLLPHDDGSVYWQVEHKYDIKTKLMNLIGDKEYVAIQGECIGPKVQGNKYKQTEPYLYVFNYITPSGRMGSVGARDMLGTRGFDFVPIVDEHFKLPATVDEMINLAHGQSKLANILREGLVVRSRDGQQSFKAVDPAYLLKWSE